LTVLRSAWTRALDAVFPPRCAGCGSFGAFICEACLGAAPRADGVRCPTCWSPGPGETCLRCYRRPPALAGARAVFRYAGAPRSAVLAIKFGGLSALAPQMGALMAESLAEWGIAIDAVVPVPLAGLRRRTRGYNQSELLARAVGRASGVPVETGALRRRKRTPPQTGQPDEAARRRNVEGAFAPGKRPATGAALLVDDVFTTGATLEACSGVLLNSGAERVYALTFTRED
jgi:ComF family protein